MMEQAGKFYIRPAKVTSANPDLKNVALND